MATSGPFTGGSTPTPIGWKSAHGESGPFRKMSGVIRSATLYARVTG